MGDRDWWMYGERERERERERESGKSMPSVTWWWWWWCEFKFEFSPSRIVLKYFKPIQSRLHLAHIITDVFYADDISLLGNISVPAKSRLHSLEKAAGGIGLHVNGSPKLVDKFTYFGSSVPSTENDMNPWLAKACNAIDRFSELWKSDLSDKINGIFSKQRSRPYYFMDVTHGRCLSLLRKSLTTVARECYELYWNGPGRKIQ